MNRKSLLIFLGILMLVSAAFASDTVFLGELFEEADKYEGQSVTVSGEAVGDIMRDGDVFWLNIRDGEFFIGVVLNEELKNKIKYLGRYKIRGDMVKVSGVYQVHCRQHRGERDIHADKLEIIRSGRELEEHIEINEVILSIILAVATVIFVLHAHRRQSRKDNAGPQN
jgi:aspartyl/asparaginyl-tRNA synthetase